MKNNVPKKVAIATVIAGSLIVGAISYKLTPWQMLRVNHGVEIKQVSARTNYLLAVPKASSQTEECLYLSDINYEPGSSAGWRSITYDKNLDDNGMISLKVDNEVRKFFKGVVAHANSTVIYNISDYDYDYFTAYIGVEANKGSNGDGVKFSIYTSVDGESWELKTPELNNQTFKGDTNARFIKVGIKGAKYLKLYADRRGNDTADHATYADAKLIKEGYEEPNEPADFIKTVEQYNEEIKAFEGQEITGEYEKALLRREFVNNLGYDYLQFLVNYKASTRDTIKWLMNGNDLVDGTADDLTNLRYFIMGGTPEGGYTNTLTQLVRLYEAYKDDFKITETTKYGTVLGDLYTRMAIAMSLTHSQTFGLWIQAGGENKTDAVRRYQIYKDMHKNGNFVVLRNEDGSPKLKADGTPELDVTKWFENYTVEEMRYIFNNQSDDEETLWLNEYTQSFVDQYPDQYGRYLSPHPYMDYRTENLNQPEFYDPARKDQWDEYFKGIFSKYNVTYRSGLKKIWMFLRNPIVNTGAVCGGISKIGSIVRTSHGIPCVVVGQPGHAAMIYYWENANGEGYWNLDNDVSGWQLSERGERLLLGWGNASSNYARGSHQVVYMMLSQAALNDYDNLVKAEELVLVAKTYSNDLKDETKKQTALAKQEELYRKALEIQPINLDAWLGLINVYNANESKQADDFYNLAEELAENLKCYPLPMYQLTNLIKPKLTSIENSYKFTLLQTRILRYASNLSNSATDQVLQPGIARTEANYLLGNMDTSIASFSFDGENANKIVLSDRFNGIGVRWDYCINGDTQNPNSWKEVSFSAEEEHKLQLTPEEVASITAENDIYVHIVGVSYDADNLYKIDIQNSRGLPSNLYANDLENRIMAAVPAMEWKLNEADAWTSYKNSAPDLTGDKTVIVRMSATGTYLAGTTTQSFTFTADNQPDTEKYIPISRISLKAVSSQQNTGDQAAVNALDGHIRTIWHSSWDGSDSARYIVIELDKEVFLSALEYYPRQDSSNGRIRSATISVSTDGENWTDVVVGTDWANNASPKKVSFETPRKAKYVRLKANTNYGDGRNFISAAMINLFEDTTAKVVPNFSFDGQNAGKIYLEGELEGVTWKYSLDGGTTWKDGTENISKLTDEELQSITAENDIKVVITESNGSQVEKVINIKKSTTPNITAYLNDLENRLIGMRDTSKLEWRTEANTEIATKSAETWTDYAKEEPIVEGNTKLLVRTKATGEYTASDSVEFIFTDDNQPDTAKYIPIKHLSIEGYSNTTVPSRGEEAEFSIDGLPTTMWHSSRTTTTMHDPRWITLKLDEPKYVSEIEYVRKAGYNFGIPKSGSVLVSMDGENWETALEFEDLYNPETVAELTASENSKTLKLTEAKQAQYIKIECTKSCDYVHGNRDGVPMDYFFSAAMFNVFEDITKIETVAPTAEVEFDITENTNQNVTATLVNESTEITVTSEGGRTHTFTENGSFTFEFVDKNGTKGTVTATVDWIIKTLPTATIKYSTETLTNQDVIAEVSFDRDNVRIVDENNQTIETIKTGSKYVYTFEKNGTHEVKFVGPYGNAGTTTLSVDWIDKTAPVGKVKYSSTNLSNKDVIATVEFDEENVTVKGGNTHIFTENGEYIFEFEDVAGNKGTAKAEVTWIDKELPTAIIDYDIKELTNKDVTATVTFTKGGKPLEGVTVEGGNRHVFEENGKYEFSFVGPAGNAGVAVAEVDWIDKEVPIAKIEYSNTQLTNKPVTATITFNEKDVTITNNDGKNTYTFEIGGRFEFEFKDKAGNTGTAVAEVDWIDKRVPKATVEYDIKELTNKDVTATITFDRENVTILNNNGENTYTFTENGKFEFDFVGPAGNVGRTAAEVDWIDKVAPTATVEYDVKTTTNGNVVATLVNKSEDIIITNNDGKDTYTFTKNGTFTFEFKDKAGNTGTAIATVNWIEEKEPEIERSFELILKADKATANPGDTVKIQLEVSKLKNVEQGLMAMLGQFEYDKNVLELVKIEGAQGWNFDKDSLNTDNLKFVTDAGSYVKSGDVITITVKVKDSVTNNLTTGFKVKNVEASDGSNAIKAKDANITINIEKKDEPTPPTPEKFTISSDKYDIKDGNIAYVLPSTTVSEFYKHITTNRTTHVMTKDGTEVKGDNLVKTGMKLTVDNENVEYTIIVLGDINEDGIMDIADLAKIKLHLIDKQKLTGIYAIAGDVDKDREITINDLAAMKLALIGLKRFE